MENGQAENCVLPTPNMSQMTTRKKTYFPNNHNNPSPMCALCFYSGTFCFPCRGHVYLFPTFFFFFSRSIVQTEVERERERKVSHQLSCAQKMRRDKAIAAVFSPLYGCAVCCWSVSLCKNSICFFRKRSILSTFSQLKFLAGASANDLSERRLSAARVDRFPSRKTTARHTNTPTFLSLITRGDVDNTSGPRLCQRQPLSHDLKVATLWILYVSLKTTVTAVFVYAAWLGVVCTVMSVIYSLRSEKYRHKSEIQEV